MRNRIVPVPVRDRSSCFVRRNHFRRLAFDEVAFLFLVDFICAGINVIDACLLWVRRSQLSGPQSAIARTTAGRSTPHRKSST